MNEIEQATAECRAAWAAQPQATWAWCCHHEVRVEPLIEPHENRIAYILAEKPEAEQVTRLNNFRPVISQLPEMLIKAKAVYDKTWADYRKAGIDYGKAEAAYDKARADLTKAGANPDVAAAHLADVPRNTWNGKDIF